MHESGIILRCFTDSKAEEAIEHGPVPVLIVGDSDIDLWGLTGAQRLRRALAARSDVALIDDSGAVPADAPLLLLRGDHAFDGAVLDALLTDRYPLTLTGEEPGYAVAIRGRGHEARQLIEALNTGRPAGDREINSPGDIASGFRAGLLSHNAPRVVKIWPQSRCALERWLFSGAYKGVTDLVTKWLWPVPAQWGVRGCIRLGLSPNAVTVFSLVLAIAALVLFAEGALGLGLAAAWLMTFLDTVDGKLARVTLTSSRFGDYLDHGIDLVHPPFWYLAWGLGLAAPWTLTPSLGVTITAIFVAYIGGRLCEGAFQWLAAPFSLFVWRPFDSFNRLITARRNPNLLLLTGGWLLGRPDVGLWAVAAWHVLSTVVLAARVAQALTARRRGAALTPWLDHVDPVRDRQRLGVRWFTQAPPADSHAGS